MSLTRRQKEIYDFLSEFLETHGYAPTLEEIAERFGLASLNGVYKHLKALEERGYISRLSNQARSIQLLQREIKTVSPVLPLLGYVAAGRPIEAIPVPEEIAVPDSFLTRNPGFVLKVSGDSMIEEHIQDGDFVIVERREQAHNGELVVALLDGENVTLKKFFRDGRSIRLQPANARLEPLVVEEERVRIQGVVIGIMRKF